VFERIPPEKTPLPVSTVRTATLDITPGMIVLARNPLPAGFVPSPGEAPMWLQNGTEIGVVGEWNAGTTVLGFGGDAYGAQRVIARDGSDEEVNGKIVDLALSPDTMELGLAVARQDSPRIDVVVRDVLAAGGGGHPVASFDGEFKTVSLGWTDKFTIALALAGPAEPNGQKQSTAKRNAPGVYLIGVNGMVIASYLKFSCELSRLVWAPDGQSAVGEGAPDVRSVLIDRKSSSCTPLPITPPIRTLGWSSESHAFAYVEPQPPDQLGSYRYDVGSGTRLIAVASGAAALIRNGNSLALGSSSLTFHNAVATPTAPVRAEIAQAGPRGVHVDVQSLGFNTTAAMLSQSTMTYSAAANAAAIVTAGESASGLERRILVYSLGSKSAFVIASGPEHGPVSLSWSPHGHYLAIIDGDAATGAALTVVEPPR
jgi:hypothetical protein